MNTITISFAEFFLKEYKTDKKKGKIFCHLNDDENIFRTAKGRH